MFGASLLLVEQRRCFYSDFYEASQVASSLCLRPANQNAMLFLWVVCFWKLKAGGGFGASGGGDDPGGRLWQRHGGVFGGGPPWGGVATDPSAFEVGSGEPFDKKLVKQVD